MRRKDPADVVIVCQRGAVVDSRVKYGALRAVTELARQLIGQGVSAVLLGLSSREEGKTEGIPFIGARTDSGLLGRLAELGRVDALIGCSRADIFTIASARKRLVYQHGPHPPEGDLAVSLIKRLRIPVAVVSIDSMHLQQKFGIPAGQLHLVRNGYDSEVFRLDRSTGRVPHRLIFAGIGVAYKGLDVAVAAFASVRESFPEAELVVYGSNVRWSRSRLDHLWREGWLTPEGIPDWNAVEHDLPGLSYEGEVEPAALANALQAASLLVMPSRIAETFGIVSIEAQACGCIPVLPARGGFPETMQVDLTGYIYEPNTPEGLARRIAELWEKHLPDDAQRIVAAEWVKREFSWARAGTTVADLLDRSDSRQHPLWNVEAFLWKTGIKGKSVLRNWANTVMGGRISSSSKRL